MVQVIDERYDAGGEKYLVFRVHKEPGDDKVYGYLLPRTYYDDDGNLQVIKTDKHMAAAEALPEAVKLAGEHGFNYVLIHDLDHLFPPEKRPALH